MRCEAPGCDAIVEPSRSTGRTGKWNFMKAEREGWFFQRDGTSWCPEHVPAWVPAWREQQRLKKEAGS